MAEAVDPPAVDPTVDRLLTVPNVITVVRLLFLPVFLWLLFGRDEPVLAALVLGALGATDWVDGYVARRWNQVSTAGKILDPVADRLLFFVGGGAILIDGSIPTGVAVLVLVREVLVSVATIALALAGAARIDVTWWGKAGTFCMMFALPLFLASSGDLARADQVRFVAWGFTVPGLVFGYIALGLYVPIALRALRAGRSGRAVAVTDPNSAR